MSPTANAQTPAPAPGEVANPTAAPNKPNCSKPGYPRESLRDEETGVVTLSMLIDVDGRALAYKIVRSTGYRRLDQATGEAFMKCVFRPTLVNGVPEKAWTTFSYSWVLE